MVNNFMAVLKTCEKCGEKYPSCCIDECPHPREVDTPEFQKRVVKMVNKPKTRKQPADGMRPIKPSRLEPKPRRLLTELKEICDRAVEGCCPEGHFGVEKCPYLGAETDDSMCGQCYLDLILAKTASIKNAEQQLAIEIADQQGFEAGCEKKDAEHQQKIAEIFEEIRKLGKDCVEGSVNETIWYIGEERLKKLESRILGGK